MDPVTIIGAAGAAINLIGVITRTVSFLRELHNIWEDADLTIVNLISQLTALRAALKKISEWISSDLADMPQHHQLVVDLKECLDCCTLLINSMDNQLAKITGKEGRKQLDMSFKIRMVLNEKASNDFQQFIQRQTSALTLLLTACNWYINHFPIICILPIDHLKQNFFRATKIA